MVGHPKANRMVFHDSDILSAMTGQLPEAVESYRMVGLSYRSAPLSVRSKVALDEAAASRLMTRIIESGATEALVLSTCNRTEIYVYGGELSAVQDALCEVSNTSREELEPYFENRTAMGVTCHLFRVASGMDSAVLGETEIVQQVKDAWRTSKATGFCGSELDLLFRSAMEAGKRIRTETSLCRGVTSIGTLAVAEALTRGDGPILLIGAGQIALRVAKGLKAESAKNVMVLNRTLDRAESLAQICDGRAGGLELLREELLKAVSVVTTVSAAQPILTNEILQSIMAMRARPLVVIDLGVPPNVEPGIEAPGLNIIDVDRLSQTAEAHLEQRLAARPAAVRILAEELNKWQNLIHKRAAGPTIKALIERAETVRQENLNRELERRPNLSEREVTLLEEMSRRLVKGLLQTPIEHLSGDMAAKEHREVIVRLFGLESPEAPADAG